MFELRAKSSSQAEMLMYGSIGEWSKVRAEDIYKNLRAAKSQGYEKVKMRMNCPGGSIFEGIAVISAIQNSDVDVSIAIDGMAASMGAAIVAAVDDVEMAEGARIMIHQGMGMSIGQSWQLRLDADLLDSLNRTLSEYFATKTGKDKKWIFDNWMADGKDKWFTAQEALDAGLVKRKIPGKAKSLPKETATFYEMAAHYDQFFKPENKMDRDELIALLGLKADATDADIKAAVAENKTKASAKVAEAPVVKKPAEGGEEKTDMTAVIDGIVALGKERGMDDKQLAALKVLAGVDMKAAMDFIPTAKSSETPAAPISVKEIIAASKSSIGVVSATDQKTWDWNEWNKHPKEFTDLLAQKPEEYIKIFSAEFGYTPTVEELKKSF